MQRSPEEVMRQREEMISQLELANAQMWSAGKRDWWFGDCDDITKQVTEEANGCLLEELIRASNHCDASAAELLRKG